MMLAYGWHLHLFLFRGIDHFRCLTGCRGATTRDKHPTIFMLCASQATHNRSLHVAGAVSPHGTSTAALKHHITKALKLDSIEVNMDFLNGLVILPYPLFLTNNCWVIPSIFTAKATTKPAALIFLSYTTLFKNQESSSPDAIERLNVHKALKNPSQSAVGSVVKSYCSGNQVTTGQGDITSLTNKEKNHQNLHKMSKFH